MVRRLGLELFSDYVRILLSGAFQHSAYARIHLGNRAWVPVALWHYLLICEARGARPCPFFDPSYAGAAPRLSEGESAFAAFLSDGAVAQAAAEFDAAWYASQNCPPAVPGLSPWHHYRRYGLPALKDPAPDVSISFFLSRTSRS